MYNKTCHICGNEFQFSAHNAKHCSHECKLEARRRRRIASLGPSKTFSVTCTQCGGSFETRSANKKYCSPECYRLATVERKRVERSKLRKKTHRNEFEMGFRGLCSVCGVDDVLVLECPECGYLSCVECYDKSGMCSICSGDPLVLALARVV